MQTIPKDIRWMWVLLPVLTFRLLSLLRGFPRGSDSKESACSVGDPGLIPGLGRSPGEGNGSPLQYSCLSILWTEEPGRLQSMRLHRVGHNRATFTHSLPKGTICFVSWWKYGPVSGDKAHCHCSSSLTVVFSTNGPWFTMVQLMTSFFTTLVQKRKAFSRNTLWILSLGPCWC